MRQSFALLFGAATFACASAPRSPENGSTVDLVIAATTDVHGRLRGWDYFAGTTEPDRGLSRAATIVDSLRQRNPGRVVLVDAGDLLQGNPLTYVHARVDTTSPHPVVAAMNAMEYDAAAIGNHEFNYGLGTLGRAISEARFPFLAANAWTPDGKQAYPAFTIVERGGVKVGIVGATTPGAMVWDRDNLAGRLSIRDIIPDLAKAVADVRAKGADVVVVTMHSGLGEPASYDTITTGVPSENVGARAAREIPGIDVIVLGHSHRELADSVIGSTMVMQAKNWATSVAVANLTIERQPSAWRVTRKRGSLVPAKGHGEQQGVLAATAKAHATTVAYVNQVIGTTNVAWRADSARVVDTPLIDFLLEVQRRRAGADLAATAAFDIRAALDSGAITVAEIARLYPYENTLRAVRISGMQLRQFLEYSARYYRTLGTREAARSIVDPTVPGYNFDIVAGAEYTLDLTRPLGVRVTALRVKGRDVASGDSFTMALNNYRQTGGGGYAMLSGAPVVYDGQEEIRQLLIDEVARRGTLRPEDYATRNWRLVPDEGVAAAYGAMHRTTPDGGPPTGASRPPANAPESAPQTRPAPVRAPAPNRMTPVNR